jgi:ABC-type sulfate/molybdate transport systems ATPase subunit
LARPIGPSGYGKTTALRIDMGPEAATSGRVTVEGRAHGLRHAVDAQREMLGYLDQG